MVLSNIAIKLIYLDFFTEYISEEDFYPVRDIKKIASRYIKYKITIIYVFIGHNSYLMSLQLFHLDC